MEYPLFRPLAEYLLATLRYTMSDTSRNYELAFHISPNMEETRVAQISNELKEQLANGQAVISFTKEPERTRLSYPIKHDASSYFGYIQFNTEKPELEDGTQGALQSVEEYIKLNNDIIRSLIVRLPSDAKKSQTMARQAKARERMEKKAKAAIPTKPVAPTDTVKLDKELEDIIEKL